MRAFAFASLVVVVAAGTACQRRALDKKGTGVLTVDGSATDALVVPEAGTTMPTSAPFERCNTFGWGPQWSLAYSPDGTRLAVHAGSLVQIYDAATGARVAWFPAGEPSVAGRRFAFTPDGGGIAVAQKDGTTKLFRSSERSFPGAGLVAFSPNGATLAIVDDADPLGVNLWRVSDATSIVVLRGHTAPIRAIAFSRDGTRLVSAGDDKEARIWNLTDGSSIAAVYDRALTDVAIATDDVFATIDDLRQLHSLRLSDGTEAPLLPPGLANDTAFMSFSTNGMALLGIGWGGGADGDSVALVSLADGKAAWQTKTIDYGQPPNQLDDWLGGVAISPDGSHAAAIMGPGGIRLFAAADGSVAHRIDGTWRWERPLMMPSYGRMVVYDTFYDLTDYTPILRVTGRVWGVAPRAPLVAATTGDIRIQHLSLVSALDGSQTLELPGIQTVTAFSPDETMVDYNGLLVSTVDGSLVRTFLTQTSLATPGLAFSPDGSLVAGAVPTNDDRQRIALWRVSDGTEVLRLGELTPMGGVWTISFVDIRFSPDGTRVAAAARDAKVWNVADGRELVAIPAPSTADGTAVGSIDPGWRWVALPDPANAMVRLYTLPEGQLVDLYTFPVDRSASVITATFTADSDLIVGWQATNSVWTADVWCKRL